MQPNQAARLRTEVRLQASSYRGQVSVFQAVELLGDIAAGKISHQAFRVIEQANGDKAGVGAHVEPVRGVGGHADQVAFAAEYFVHLVLDVQCEQALAFHEEAHFVFAVAVLSRNFCRNAAFSG